MRHRLLAVLGSLAASILLAVCTPTSSYAATGFFDYHLQPGSVLEVLRNPQDEACYGVGEAAGRVENGTNRDALLYTLSGCRGSVVHTVHAGESADWAEFNSVKFVR
ncbi:hypothetical protein EF912_27900 [Streptomyces sp. WAC07061]|uniref:hypothetical protein n=1 Tax=Streptomyces sp. WAC07061 TaxID=2487410 RepID=UPI000F7A718F|nr:hypothetical protein [Streptomyces sp. WAC07061]RSS46002.1 hypothetical protein EF912_27900 [Streptomyces sp. WAC07061]